MIILFLIYAFVCLWKVQLKPANGEKYITDYMSVDKTMSIKGIFIIMVFFSHFHSYVTFTAPLDIAYLNVFKNIGQCMVTLFMFYSGYGVMESVRKKGISYVHKIPLTRVLGTYFRFDIAIIIFALVQLALGKVFPAKQYILSLTGWDSVGNSNWYIFAIVVAYAVTFIAFEIGRDKGKYVVSAAILTVGILSYIYILAHFKLKDAYWFDTIICYACGVWYSLLREKVEKIINHNVFIYIATLLITVAGTLYFMKTRGNSFVHRELCMLFFTAFVVVLSMRVSFHNKVLMWCGQHLFGLYILQRIPMIIFRAVGVADFNIYLYFVLCLVVTVPMSYLFEKYTGKLWKLITSPKKKSA